MLENEKSKQNRLRKIFNCIGTFLIPNWIGKILTSVESDISIKKFNKELKIRKNKNRNRNKDEEQFKRNNNNGNDSNKKIQEKELKEKSTHSSLRSLRDGSFLRVLMDHF